MRNLNVFQCFMIVWVGGAVLVLAILGLNSHNVHPAVLTGVILGPLVAALIPAFFSKKYDAFLRKVVHEFDKTN